MFSVVVVLFEHNSICEFSGIADSLNGNFIITWVDPNEVKLIYLVFFIKMSLK